MNVELKLFAGAKQAVGRSSISLELADRATVSDLRRTLAEQFPALQPLLPRAMFSINLDYAGDNAEIPPEAEVACIPPVSGG